MINPFALTTTRCLSVRHQETAREEKKRQEQQQLELEQPPAPEDAPPLSWRQRAKTFALEYGRVGIATHAVLSLVSFSAIYVGVTSGVDVHAIVDFFGVSNPAIKDTATSSAGSFLIAYTVYKISAPVRWPLTFAVTPIVLRALRRRGYMLPAAPASHPSARED